ncbi:polysaccharide deacetylase [Streptomyces sp. NPDC006872]|uniref:polysaccharide deacetylase n=1 Tax=Streptomyces sp. NPDC006872 TaxID=3155720 RepID=UPI00340F04F7
MAERVYSYSPINEREPIPWPDGKRVAFYLGVNIEYMHADLIGMGAHNYANRQAVSAHPAPKEHGWFDYGSRVGIWRMIDLLDECGVPATAITNSEVVEHHPQIIEAGLARDWAWVAHGQTNSVMHNGFAPGEEAHVLDDIVATFGKTGIRPRGWMGPGLSETFETHRLLRERGFDYTLDWVSDDRPFAVDEPGFVAVPYTMDINDMPLFFTHSTTPREYEEIVMDQLEVLLDEGGGVFALPVHPYVVGVPFRFKYFAQVLRAVASHPDVWVTTTDAITDHFRSVSGLQREVTSNATRPTGR